MVRAAVFNEVVEKLIDSNAAWYEDSVVDPVSVSTPVAALKLPVIPF